MVDVLVTESALIDGLQLVERVMPTADKIACIIKFRDAGISEIDVASFVPPRILPQFFDADELCRFALSMPGLSSRVYAPNVRGAQRALAAGARYISYGFSASEAHSHSNYRRSRTDQLSAFRELIELRDSLSLEERPVMQVSFSCVFGCSLEGYVDSARTSRYADEFLKAGADEVQLCDTVGYANPQQVRRIVGDMRRAFGPAIKSLHFHDTRGLGLANVLAGLDVGVTHFDSTCGGLGGCPFAPGATGNINSEDLVFMLESMGLDTGISLDGLLEARSVLSEKLIDIPLTGAVAKAGLPLAYHPAA